MVRRDICIGCLVRVLHTAHGAQQSRYRGHSSRDANEGSLARAGTTPSFIGRDLYRDVAHTNQLSIAGSSLRCLAGAGHLHVRSVRHRSAQTCSSFIAMPASRSRADGDHHEAPLLAQDERTTPILASSSNSCSPVPASRAPPRSAIKCHHIQYLRDGSSEGSRLARRLLNEESNLNRSRST